MSQSSKKKKFLNGFDYLLMPFVIAVGLNSRQLSKFG